MRSAGPSELARGGHRAPGVQPIGRDPRRVRERIVRDGLGRERAVLGLGQWPLPDGRRLRPHGFEDDHAPDRRIAGGEEAAGRAVRELREAPITAGWEREPPRPFPSIRRGRSTRSRPIPVDRDRAGRDDAGGLEEARERHPRAARKRKHVPGTAPHGLRPSRERRQEPARCEVESSHPAAAAHLEVGRRVFAARSEACPEVGDPEQQHVTVSLPVPGARVRRGALWRRHHEARRLRCGVRSAGRACCGEPLGRRSTRHQRCGHQRNDHQAGLAAPEPEGPRSHSRGACPRCRPEMQCTLWRHQEIIIDFE